MASSLYYSRKYMTLPCFIFTRVRSDHKWSIVAMSGLELSNLFLAVKFQIKIQKPIWGKFRQKHSDYCSKCTEKRRCYPPWLSDVTGNIKRDARTWKTTPRSGRHSTSRIVANVKHVRYVVRFDCQLTVPQIARGLGMNRNSV